MRLLLLAVIVFQFSFSSHCQSADSLRRSVDSSAKEIQRSYQNLEDSLYRLRLQRNIDEKGQELEKFLADYEARQTKEKRQIYIRVGAAMIFFAALVYGIIRKRKQKAKPPN